MRAHPDDEEKVDTLVTHIQAYLYQKGEYDGQGFAPALCNRIDRFTGGIVIAAKTREALLVMDQKIRDHEVRKFYLCAAFGRLIPPEGALRGYLTKIGKRVAVQRQNAPGAQYAETAVPGTVLRRRGFASGMRTSDGQDAPDPRAASPRRGIR